MKTIDVDPIDPGDDDIDLIQKSLYDRGWLYAIQGDPGTDCTDVQGYMDHLDATIDRMLGEEQK